MAKPKRARRNPMKFKNGHVAYPERCSRRASEQVMGERALHVLPPTKRVGTCTPRDASAALRYGTNGAQFHATVRRAIAHTPKTAAGARSHASKLRKHLAACGDNKALRRELQTALQALQRLQKQLSKSRGAPMKKPSRRAARKNPGRARQNPTVDKEGRTLALHCSLPKAERTMAENRRRRKNHKKLLKKTSNRSGTYCTPKSASIVIQRGHGRKGKGKGVKTIHSRAAGPTKASGGSTWDAIWNYEPLGAATNPY